MQRSVWCAWWRPELFMVGLYCASSSCRCSPSHTHAHRQGRLFYVPHVCLREPTRTVHRICIQTNSMVGLVARGEQLCPFDPREPKSTEAHLYYLAGFKCVTDIFYFCLFFLTLVSLSLSLFAYSLLFFNDHLRGCLNTCHL